MPLTCPRCGGDVENQQNHIPASGTLFSCHYCSATLYCQQGFCLSPETTTALLELTEAKRILRRWFREKHHLLPAIQGGRLQYLPFWVLTDQKGEKYQTLAVNLPPETPPPPLPEGQREPITLELTKEKNWPQPTITLETVSQGKSVQEALLIWAPFYWITYKGKNKIQGAWVDASLGVVSPGLTDILPKKIPFFNFNLSPAGYYILGAIAALSAATGFFSPHLILSLFLALALALAGYLPLTYWGKKDED